MGNLSFRFEVCRSVSCTATSGFKLSLLGNYLNLLRGVGEQQFLETEKKISNRLSRSQLTFGWTEEGRKKEKRHAGRESGGDGSSVVRPDGL